MLFSMITVCILTKNAATTLAATLDSVREFKEVLILDNGSSDATLDIAKNYPNVRIVQTPFIGFGPLRNQAAKLASHDWILALDSDEILSPPLLRELSQLSFDPQTAYVFPRHNYYNNKRILGCGWDPEFVARLYHRHQTQYTPSQVHESLLTTQTHTLENPLLHTPFRSSSEFIAKMQHYSTLFAEQNKGHPSSFLKALGHGFFAFFRSYFLKKGFLCGREGFLISLYNANTTFYKYIKLCEVNEEL
jgi:glycosyltransferase involved in cell wall biosynthesis